MSKTVSPHIPVKHIAKLANIPVTDDEAAKFEAAFVETLAVVEKLQAINVKNVKPTFQVTGLQNVLREDVVNEAKTFSQKQALANAPKTYQGFVVVNQVIEQD